MRICKEVVEKQRSTASLAVISALVYLLFVRLKLNLSAPVEYLLHAGIKSILLPNDASLKNHDLENWILQRKIKKYITLSSQCHRGIHETVSD